MSMADLSFTATVGAMRQSGLTHHDKNPVPPIWELAARNNAKQKKTTYRINGQRVSRSEFEAFNRA